MSRYQAYPEYKKSGMEWLEAIPVHWSLSKLRYAFSFGKGLSITKENLVDEGIPCVNYGELHSKFGFEVDPSRHQLRCVEHSYLKTSPSALLRKGDFVFADTSEDIEGSGNFTQLISDIPTFAGYHTIIVRPECIDNARFFAYLFDSIEFRTRIRHAVKGVKVFSITQAILRDADVWLPSRAEQEKIAAFLDHETTKIDALIEKQQRLIELLKEERQAVISHAVTKGLNPNAPMKDSGVEWLGEVPAHWLKIQLKAVIKTRKGIAFKSDDFSDHGILVVRASDIKERTIRVSDVFLPASFFQRFPKAVLNKGDIVLSTVGSNPDVKNSAVGQLGMLPDELDGSLLNQNTVVFDPSEKVIIKDYLFNLIQTTGYRDHLDLHAHGTANQSSLSIKDMLNFVACIPSIVEQLAICVFLSEMQTKLSLLEVKANASMLLLQERRTALISAAVTGKIDVRAWQAAA